MNDSPKRGGFTLIEMLVVVAIIGLLVALLVPALARAREAARNSVCKNNLRAFGQAFAIHAGRDPRGRYCTGAYDYRRDGCPDTWGWVADIVNMGAGIPSEMTCPSNPIQALEKFNDLLGQSTTSPKEGCPPSRLREGACGLGGGFGGTAANDPARGDYIARMFVDKGYTTNYASSWFMVRGGIRFAWEDSDGDGKNDHGTNVSWQDGAFKGLGGTTGPLTSNVVETSPVASSVIPLLGDTAPGDVKEAILALDITKDASVASGSLNVDPNEPIETYFAGGDRLGESFNDGPAFFDSSALRIDLLDSLTDMTAQIQEEAAGVGVTPPVDGSGTFLQDTRDWYAVHGSGNKRSCNILMADGSVQEFTDLNGDGYLNPGFPVPDENGSSPLTQSQYMGIGYRSSLVEMPPAMCFNGVFLRSFVSKGSFE